MFISLLIVMISPVISYFAFAFAKPVFPSVLGVIDCSAAVLHDSLGCHWIN